MRGLHAITERVLIARLGGWEVRRHHERGDHHAYASPRFLQLQLWNPEAGISVLTPSRLTGGFEIARDGLRIAVPRWRDVVVHLADHVVPSGAELAALHVWTIVRAELRVRRRTHVSAQEAR